MPSPEALANVHNVMYINVMNVNDVNKLLLTGEIDRKRVFPHLDSLKRAPVVFDTGIGLPNLPEKPGILMIRGARQYGKSTWLEKGLRDTIHSYGAGSGFYLNGDEIRDSRDLIDQIRILISLFPPHAAVKRIFIDEITAVENWEKALKRLADTDEIYDVLIVTTGSKATDLRRGTERLPGRKGRLDRTWYHFPPLSFAEFLRAGGNRLEEDASISYILSGGCPVAAGEIIANRMIPEYISEMIRDWIYGEVVAGGRNRSSLLGIFEVINRYGGTPCGQAKVARESGLANNTVAAGYIELLMDLMCLGSATAWDHQKKTAIRRKPAKYHFTNLLAAASWAPSHPDSVSEFRSLTPQSQGAWLEWAVAQELWRRAAVAGEDFPERMYYWQGGGHELDFVLKENHFLEVKRGRCSPTEFTWVPQTLPGVYVTIINASRFETSFCRGITLEDFLLERDGENPAEPVG